MHYCVSVSGVRAYDESDVVDHKELHATFGRGRRRFYQDKLR